MESAVTQKKRWTYRDYLKLEDDKRYEIINGELIMAPSPLTVHQKIGIELKFELTQYVKRKNLGSLLDAPMDVVISEDNLFQPDIFFVSKERENIIKKEYVEGAPDLVVEILSPTTMLNDLTFKKDVYEQAGVKELWYVSPQEKSIVIYRNTENGFKQQDAARQEGRVKSRLLQDFAIELKELFKEE